MELAEKIPRQNPRGRERTLQAKRAKQVMKNEVSRDLRKNKVKDTAQHGAVGSNRRVGERERAAEVKEKVSHLSNRRARHRVPMTVTPGAIN